MKPELVSALDEAVARDASDTRFEGVPRLAVDRLVEHARGTVRAVLFFGSRMSGAGANVHSAYDLFVVVSDYRAFYEAMADARLSRKSSIFLATLNRFLPPNQFSLKMDDEKLDSPFHGKCAVISLHHFLRETSPKRRDHFCQGRLFQPVALLYAHDEPTRLAILGALTNVRRQTVRWVAPHLPRAFGIEEYCLRCLVVSLAGELRPESSSRAVRLAQAQRERQRSVYGALFALLDSEGVLTGVGEGIWRLARDPSGSQRLVCRSYFALSLVRATLRWAKHMLTFEDWLDYLVRKVERHSGQRIELTPRERRFPLVFLWPHFVRHMRSKNQEAHK
jgi:hypothetical protein